jgi:hypothetical protein
MARRQSSSVLAAILVLFAGNVVFSLGAYFAWQDALRAKADAETARGERDAARKTQAATTSQADALRQRLTRVPGVEFAELLGSIDDDLRQFGSGAPNETYADVVRRLQSMIEIHRTELKQVMADKSVLQREFEASQQVKQQTVDQAKAATQEANKDLLTERSDFIRKMSAKDQEILSIMDHAKTLANKLETETREKEKIHEELLGEVNKLRRILVEARAPFTPNALARQKPDGSVVRSSAATKTVWLNIGSKHGVEPQLTFSVQPSGFTGNPFTKPKAKIEVIAVSGSDLAEARIIESSLTNPIIAGDQVFNPAWNPGRVMRFALAGLMDIDDDGVDDRAKIRQMIRIAGARIDAEIMPDGTQQGEVSVETNYFVRGGRPDPEKAGPLQLKVLASMAKMERTSLDYGAVVIDLDKFLDLVGYAPGPGR